MAARRQGNQVLNFRLTIRTSIRPWRAPPIRCCASRPELKAYVDALIDTVAALPGAEGIYTAGPSTLFIRSPGRGLTDG